MTNFHSYGIFLDAETVTPGISSGHLFQGSGNSSSSSLGPLDMFQAGHLERTLILLAVWITSVLAYYAITLNSTSLVCIQQFYIALLFLGLVIPSTDA